MKVSQSCPTLQPHGLYSPWNSPGWNTGVGSLSILWGIFQTQGLNPDIPHCRQIVYQLSHKGSPRILEWVAYLFSSGSSQPGNQTRVSCIAGGFFCIAGGFFTTWTMFSSVSQSCLTLCDPVNHSTQGLPVHHKLPEFTQAHAHRVGDAIQPSHPLSSPSPPAPNPSQHQGLFQRVNSLHEVAKVLELMLGVDIFYLYSSNCPSLRLKALLL